MTIPAVIETASFEDRYVSPPPSPPSPGRSVSSHDSNSKSSSSSSSSSASLQQRNRTFVVVCLVLTTVAMCLQSQSQLLGLQSSFPGEYKNRDDENKFEKALRTKAAAAAVTSSEDSSSASSDEAPSEATPPCKPLPPLRWEFQNYKDHSSSKFTPSKRLLIGMYSGFDKYAGMLEVTSILNKAYAKRWGHSTVVLQGVAMHLGDVDGGHGCTPKAGVRAAFNKIKILEYALNHTDKFDQLLLVDTDAMIYNLNFDITSLLQDDTQDMLVAHKVHSANPDRGSWDVNNGVTLWNLRHNETRGVARDWDEISREVLTRREGYGGDQHQLHKALRQGPQAHTRMQSTIGTYKEFFYGHGSVVRHYIRLDKNWNAPNPLENRIMHLKDSREKACKKYPAEVCDSVKRVSYAIADE